MDEIKENMIIQLITILHEDFVIIFEKYKCMRSMEKYFGEAYNSFAQSDNPERGLSDYFQKV